LARPAKIPPVALRKKLELGADGCKMTPTEEGLPLFAAGQRAWASCKGSLFYFKWFLIKLLVDNYLLHSDIPTD
jgi:hypothetical protein